MTCRIGVVKFSQLIKFKKWIVSLVCVVVQSKKRPRFFWVSAMAPLTSVILGSLLVYFTHAEKHGVEVVSISFSCYYLCLSLS